MPKKKIPVVKPLEVPEPCVIDELPEVFTRHRFIYSSDIVLSECGALIKCSRFWCMEDMFADDIRYVAGVE